MQIIFLFYNKYSLTPTQVFTDNYQNPMFSFNCTHKAKKL